MGMLGLSDTSRECLLLCTPGTALSGTVDKTRLLNPRAHPGMRNPKESSSIEDGGPAAAVERLGPASGGHSTAKGGCPCRSVAWRPLQPSGPFARLAQTDMWVAPLSSCEPHVAIAVAAVREGRTVMRVGPTCGPRK